MGSDLLQKLADKSMTKNELRLKVVQNFDLLSIILYGLTSPKAAVRYGCAKLLKEFK